MHVPGDPELHPLVRHLRSTTDLDDLDVAELVKLPVTERELGKGQIVVREGERPTQCCLVLDGFTCRSRVLRDGSRQIVAFNVAGDLPDLQSLHLDTMDHDLATLAPSVLGFIAHEPLRALTVKRPQIAAALWRQTLIDGAIFREWMTGLGRRPAPARLAHLLCELMARLAAVGLVEGGRVDLPITQTDLGDALGLSYVHINRILQDLRRDGLIELKRRVLTVHDWPRLSALAEFDPIYLHFRRPPSMPLG